MEAGLIWLLLFIIPFYLKTLSEFLVRRSHGFPHELIVVLLLNLRLLLKISIHVQIKAHISITFDV